MEAIEVTKLDDGTHALVVGDDLAAECLFVVGHILGLYLHAETTRHGNVTAIFERSGAEHSVVGHSRDVGGHGYGGEEIGSAPLHIDALQTIGVVAHPELIEVREKAIVGTSTTRSTILDDDVWIFCADALAELNERLVIFDVKMALFFHWQVLAAMIHHRSVGIPLDVCNFRIVAEQVVEDAESVVLHLGISEVEDDLCATTSLHGFASWSLDDPVGMSLIELGDSVGHLGFDPDAELHTVLLGIAQQTGNAIGEFACIDHPVAERRVVDIAWILIAKPTIVHHEEFATH